MERKWWTLVLISIATFMLLLDITVVNVALPDIQRDLDASLSSLQLVVDAYSLTLAAFLLTAGSLGDRLGRRRVFSVGFAIFTLASFLCGIAGDPAEERGQGEDREADGEDAPAPQAVAQRPSRQQEGGERQRVGVDHQLQTGEAGVEVALDVGQGDVDDRDVQQQHERRDRDQDEGPPLALHRRTP